MVTAAIILIAGARLTRVADRLADITGLGEAVFGAVLLGGSTSLAGVVTSVTAAYDGYPTLAVSNAVGGIAAQTAFLAIADMAYRRANLEHAAASVENLLQATLLIALLAIPLVAASAPPVAVAGIHPVSAVLIAAYVFGLRLTKRAGDTPLWRPRWTPETRNDVPREAHADGTTTRRLWVAFGGFAAIVAASGYLVAVTGIALVERAGLSESVVGALITAVATSTPELVTSVAAVRQGALTLAVGGVVGGNTFDTLFLAFADGAYRDGSIYHAMRPAETFLIALTIVLTAILLLGLLRRERSGIANIGFESFLVLLLYAGAILFLALGA